MLLIVSPTAISQDFRDFLELRDPLLGSRVARRSCSPVGAPASPRVSRAEDEKSVALPLLSLDLGKR